MLRETMLIILILASVFVVCAQGKCQSSTFYATNDTKGLYYYNYEPNDDCTITILPNSLFTSGYYLEIIWNTFGINGSMPNCFNGSIEVFLTKQERSIGKYCSSNTGQDKLFNMYSHDGNARIHFKSNYSSTGKGFYFTYQLKSYQKVMGTYGKQVCYYNAESTYYGIFYPSGWPKGYTDGNCLHKFTVPEGKQARIAVMDLDLKIRRWNCDSNTDYFQIRESQTSYNDLGQILKYSSAVSSKFCGSHSPMYFTASKPYVYLYINKPDGSYPFSSNRGIMTGYITYNASNIADIKEEKKGNSSKVSYKLVLVLVLVVSFSWGCLFGA